MARGSSYGEDRTNSPVPTTTPTSIPRRATRAIQAVQVEEEEPETQLARPVRTRRAPQTFEPPRSRVVDSVRPRPYSVEPHPLARHHPWLRRLLVTLGCVVIGALVLAAAGMYLRPSSSPSLVYYDGQTFSLTTYNLINTNGPAPIQTPLPKHTGPYSVLGKPTISAAFINQVLASYHSPAAGLGQDLYDRGVKYGIDPVYALAFFMHESLFGTTGEARVTLSLGNERCIPDRPCIDQDRGGYAKMNSWQDGFEHWYQLIRNLYVAQWGRVTVDQIIPKYAPNSDGNNEAQYIATLKHEVDTWRAGILRP